MAKADYSNFLNVEADTKEEIKAEKKSKRFFSTIKIGNLAMACSALLSIIMLGGTYFVASSQKSETHSILSNVSHQVKELEKKNQKNIEKSYTLTEEEYKQNIEVLTTIDTLKEDKKNGLGGSFVAGKKCYSVVKYDRMTGQLFTIQTDNVPTTNTKGTPVIMSKSWVETLVARLKSNKE